MPVLLCLLDWVAFFYPVGGEIVGEEKDAEVGEAHVAESGESGAEVGAVVEGAAAAIDYEIRGAWEGCSEFFQVGEALFGLSGAVENGAGNVGACVERMEADVDDQWLLCAL